MKPLAWSPEGQSLAVTGPNSYFISYMEHRNFGDECTSPTKHRWKKRLPTKA